VDLSAAVALIVVGLVTGIMARIAMPGPDPGGIFITTIVGIAGSFIGWLAVYNLFDVDSGSTGFLGSVLVATLGAILLLVVYRLITRQASA
jgi:uncharacterized membrane protein YeaQ/YmgE (transglycosylase-associated protein family)